MANNRAVQLDGNSLTLEKAEKIAYGADVVIAQSVKNGIRTARKLVMDHASKKKATYGLNTGFGYLAKRKIKKSQIKQLQTNLIKSHAIGFGNPLSIPETRLAMSLRLNVLLKGMTGVRYELCEALSHLIAAEIYPIIPEYGSVGASGDLAPLAHLALSLIGEGNVYYRGDIIPAMDALLEEGLEPIQLAEKEGLSLINGTQIMLAVGGLALTKAQKLLELADQITALSYEGLTGNVDALSSWIHKARNQNGQIASADAIRKELEGSYLFQPSTKRLRVQDPYSLRCAPQIHGPSRDSITYSSQIIERELNALTDNPLVFTSSKKILSGGNFHGQALALAFDFASMAMAEIGNVSERRLELLMNPNKSGLPAFLVNDDGLNSGYMTTQYLSASLVNENKLLANPSCTDSIPGNVGIEDHVSMGMTSARKLKKIVKNIKVILAVEMMAAAQAIDMREVKKLGQGTHRLHHAIRKHVPMLKKDRILADDVNTLVAFIDEKIGDFDETL